MAGGAVQDVTPAAEEGGGVNRAAAAGLNGRPAVAANLRTGGGEAAAVAEAATSAESSTAAATKAGNAGSTNDAGSRGNSRKFTRLRSAAFSFANGVTRMHSRLRAATTGSVSSSAAKALATSAAESDALAGTRRPASGSTFNTAAPSSSLSSSSSSSAAGAADSGSGNASAATSVLSTSKNSTAQLTCNTSPVYADQSSGSPERFLARVEEGDEATDAQQQHNDVSPRALPGVVAASAQQTAAGDAEVQEEHNAAAENASPATTATRASVMSTDLGGFYRKLLGEDWQEQLKELNEESNPLLAFEGSETPDAAAGTAAPTSLGGAAAAAGGDELQLPDTYQGKTRQRIRRRDATDKTRDISDQVADDLHFGQDEEPLITPEDIAVIREQAWIPAGEGVPNLSEMELGYHRAWDVGKKGCLAVKVDGLWDSAVKGNKMRFFVMDGTDPESFLSFYSKSDLHAARGLQSERLGTLTAWDMRDGYWNYPKKKIFVNRTDVKKNKDCILEGFTAEFYDAMLLCIWEMCVQAATEQLKHQRRRERARRRQSLGLGLGGVSGDRRRSQTPAGDTRRVSAALLAYKDLPRGGGAGSGAGSPQAKKVAAAARQEKVAAQHREVMRQLIREGRMLLARPIRSRNGAARRRDGEGTGGWRARSARRKAPQGSQQLQPEKREAEGGKETTSGQPSGHAATGGEEEAAANTVLFPTAGRRGPAAAAGAAGGAAAAAGQPDTGGAAFDVFAGRVGGGAERAGRQKREPSCKSSLQEAGERGEKMQSGCAAAADAGPSAVTTAVDVNKRRPAGATSAGGAPGAGGGGEENGEWLRRSAGERAVEDGVQLFEAQQQKDLAGGDLQAARRRAAAEEVRGEGRDAACRAGRSRGTHFEAGNAGGDSGDASASALAQKEGGEGRASVRGAAGERGQRHGGAPASGTETRVRYRGRDWEAGEGEASFERQEKTDAAGGETGTVERREMRAAAAGADAAAVAVFAVSGEDKPVARFAVSAGERRGQTDTAEMGGRRTTHAVQRMTRTRPGGSAEDEETHVWEYDSSNSSISGTMVERRKLRSESTAGDVSPQKAAAGGGAGAAATALGLLLPWRKLAGGVSKKGGEGANGKEKQGDAAGGDQAAAAAERGTSAAGTRREEEAGTKGKKVAVKDEGSGFNGTLREVMVADGIQWKPGKSTAEKPGRRRAGTNFLSTQDQVHRVSAVETPMLTPELLSPRDSGMESPLFG